MTALYQVLCDISEEFVSSIFDPVLCYGIGDCLDPGTLLMLHWTGKVVSPPIWINSRQMKRLRLRFLEHMHSGCAHITMNKWLLWTSCWRWKPWYVMGDDISILEVALKTLFICAKVCRILETWWKFTPSEYCTEVNHFCCLKYKTLMYVHGCKVKSLQVFFIE